MNAPLFQNEIVLSILCLLFLFSLVFLVIALVNNKFTMKLRIRTIAVIISSLWAVFCSAQAEPYVDATLGLNLINISGRANVDAGINIDGFTAELNGIFSDHQKLGVSVGYQVRKDNRQSEDAAVRFYLGPIYGRYALEDYNKEYTADVKTQLHMMYGIKILHGSLAFDMRLLTVDKGQLPEFNVMVGFKVVQLIGWMTN